jgi:transposase
VVGSIYALCDPATGQPRYVGQTTGRVDERLRQHLGTARRGSRLVCRWLRSLGGPPRVQILQQVAVDVRDLDTAECRWIRRLRNRGYALTNASPGGRRSLPAYSQADALAVCRAYSQGGVTQLALAARFGLSEKTIWRILRDGLQEHRTCKLSNADVVTIRETYAAGAIRQRDLAKRFGVSQATISNIVHGRFRH